MKKIIRWLAVLLLLGLAAAAGWLAARQEVWFGQTATHTVLTREGVLTQIQQVNRLESTIFYIDTIVKTQKAGKWYRLWQDAQSGLFVARGKVVAGVDLAKLKPDNVQIVDGKAIISMPPPEVLSVDLADLDVYDIKTGSFGLTPIDSSVFQEVQVQAKRQVLASACQADILKHAQTQAQGQLEMLFALTQTQVSVYPQALPACKA